jgi:hypothetical protein
VPVTLANSPNVPGPSIPRVQCNNPLIKLNFNSVACSRTPRTPRARRRRAVAVPLKKQETATAAFELLASQMSGTGGAAREVVAVSSTSSESSDEHALLVRPAEIVTVGGEFFAFHSTAIELKDRKLSEDELLPLLESFRDGKFPWMRVLNLVTLDCNITKMLLGVTHVLQDGNQIGDRGAEIIGEGLKVNSSLRDLHLVRLCFFGLSFGCCWGVDGEGGEGLSCSVRSCI